MPSMGNVQSMGIKQYCGPLMLQLFIMLSPEMGQIESKIFEEAPPWDMDTLLSNTDLDKTAINLCWRNWQVSMQPLNPTRLLI